MPDKLIRLCPFKDSDFPSVNSRMVGLGRFERPTYGLGNLFESNSQLVERMAESPATLLFSVR
jgi:hypothetical protein